MLLFGRLLSFCDSTYWPLVIDVYTRYLIDDNFIKTCFLLDVEYFSRECGV